MANSFMKVIMSMGCLSGQQESDVVVDEHDALDPPHPLDGVPATYDEAQNFDFHRSKQENQMKKSEELFLHEFKKMLSSGFKLIKHDAEAPSETLVLRLCGRSISWTDQSPPVRLSDVRLVERGGYHEVSPTLDDRCFVIILDEFSHVVFQTVDNETRELIVDGFDLLLATSHEEEIDDNNTRIPSTSSSNEFD